MEWIELKAKVNELAGSAATLLWLEGARCEFVQKITCHGKRIVLELGGGTTRILAYDQVATTRVGLQFWLHGRPGVLYRWDQVPKVSSA